MKKTALFLAVFMLFSLISGCGQEPQSQEPEIEELPEEQEEHTDEVAEKRVLVAYFSATNNTKGVAEKIAASMDGTDLYEIVPSQPYTSADLNYNSDCRANREQNDPSARPEISGEVENWEDYDIVFIGFPIWWGVAPKIIHTFMESYDFADKTVVTFCTSGSSPLSDAAIKELASGAEWVTGARFSASAAQDEVADWISGLELDLTQKN